MMNTKKLSIIIFFLIMLIFLIYSVLYVGREGFQPNLLPGKLNDKNFNLLVSDTYSPIGNKIISDNDSRKIWWHYPTFKLGSYKQITNNLKYPNNPDVGRCTPSQMCGSFYHKDKQPESNYASSIPPPPENETRIGYFSTNHRFIDNLPFINNGNILF